MVALALAGVGDDDVYEHLRQQGVAVQVRHAVPRVAMRRVHEIEHLHLIPIPAEHLGSVAVEFALGVCDHCGFPAFQYSKERRTDDASGLHGPGRTEYSDVPVESGVLG